MEARQASLASEQLLHGGLFEIALLGDEPVQRAQQRVHIAQCFRDRVLFGKGWQLNPQAGKCALIEVNHRGPDRRVCNGRDSL